jgi:nanoRNase/pAp phosphatase (c-di-AMP/oligoRNAs hydrolase)
MALKETQQIVETIKRSKKPLICIPTGGGPDSYATALGFSYILKKMEKEPEIVAAEGKAPKSIHFLKNHETISDKLENLQQFVIKLDAKHTQVDELSYEVKDDVLQICLSPKKGFWQEKDVRTSSSGYRFDLIICIGAPDLESYSHIYNEHPDFFFNTPIINIDHAPENEHFGQINIVDLTASACGEVCHDMFEIIEPGLIDNDTATAFLTGMIAKTKSFKHSRVTPKTLQTASKLMAKGAERETIVRELYRTRSVHTLRLWGRALARLKADEHVNIVWSLLSQQDFMHAGGKEEDLPDVIDELIASSPKAKIVVLLYEDREHHICGIIRAERPFDAIALAARFKPAGTREEVRLCFTNKTIVEVEKELIGQLRKQLVEMN